MIPDEESGIRNGNVRVSRDFCHRFCEPCSIYSAKTPGFILYIIICLYTPGDFVGPRRQYKAALSRPCHCDGAGRQNWFYYKSEMFVIWTVLLAGICWDIDLTTLLPKVVWNDECMHGRKFVS